jgi:hypothetical protein
VVATERRNEPPHLLAAHICSILWQVARIVNVVVFIPNQFEYLPLHAMTTTKRTAADRLNLYTWFPFKFGRCGEVQEVILLDEWVIEHNGRFSENANLYPAKVPKIFMGCPIKLETVGIDPLVIMRENYTQNDGRIPYKLTGLSVEIVQVVCEKMNLTTIFLAPSLNTEIDSYVKVATELDEGLSDVVTGMVPLLSFVVTSSFEATIPYIYLKANMLVPCPKAIPGTQKLLTIFSLSVWLTMGFVLFLTTAVFWCAGNVTSRNVGNETHTYQSLSHCFQNAWAVFMAVSVPHQPTTSTLRVFFFLYVCFCFAISTLFQAFFVSYLVEPMYEKKIETLDDLLESDVVFGIHPIVHFAKEFANIPELDNFLEHKRPTEECTDLRKCVERMITKRDMAYFISSDYVTFVARDLGTVDVGKIICSLDETVLSGVAIIIFKKGNPFLDRFNILMRRYLEAGFLDRLWSELQHGASLRGGGRFGESTNVMFYAFSFSHLMPAFVVLIVGTVLSSVVFIAELIVNCLCKRWEKRIRSLGE